MQLIAMQFVPDEQTAARIAEAVLTPMFGEEQIAKEKPFHVKLDGDTWFVVGSMPECPPERPCAGGAAFAEISRRDGRILRAGHYQ